MNEKNVKLKKEYKKNQQTKDNKNRFTKDDEELKKQKLREPVKGARPMGGSLSE